MSVVTALLVIALPCPFGLPVDGPIVRDFAPVGSYGGHWGIDVAAGVGTPFHAVAPGRVTFADQVGGRLSVTVDHGGGVRSSYSYLSGIAVAVGDRVGVTTVLGWSGEDHGIGAVHVSLRVGTEYVRPQLGSCRLVPAPGLRLAGSFAPRPYPSRRATRHPRRHIRSTTHRPSDRRGDRLSRVGSRRGDVHPGRLALAEG